jgi:hypothetical protein
MNAKDERITVQLRIVVEDPPDGVRFALQRGATSKGELLPPATSDKVLAFELEVAVEGSLPDGRPRLLGPFVQGPPGGRFVSLCVGQGAGQLGSPFNGRVKVPLGGLTHGLVAGLKPGQRLEARITGRGRNGGPVYASVPLLPPGWSATP